MSTYWGIFYLKKMNHFENYIALKEQALRVTNILNNIDSEQYSWSVNDIHCIDVLIEHGCMDTNIVVILNYDIINDCQPDGSYIEDCIMFPYEFLYDNEIEIQKKIKK
jgi:hypothetical protein